MASDSPRVSYLISTRNRAPFLDRTLQNVREFITREDELIIIDGASTDNTVEIVKRHADIVTVFRSEPDHGEAHGFNKAILASRGRYIKFIADDDYTYADAMTYAISVMESHPEIDAIQCGGECFRIDSETRQPEFLCYEYLPPDRRLSENVVHIMNYVPCGLGLILRRTIVSRIGLFDTTWLAADMDIMSKLILCKAEFKYLNIKLYRHTEHPHSGTHQWDLCLRDRVRALLRVSAWNEVAKYPWSALSEALGLANRPGGDAMAKIIRGGVSFLDNQIPYLKFLAGLVRWVQMFRAFIWRFQKSNSRADTPTGGFPTVEPVWDGDLR